MTGKVSSALVLEEPRRLLPRQLAQPELTDDTGVLRVEACGLCGTDHEQFTGAIATGFSFIPGHEIVGTVEEVGSAAAARWGVPLGDRVAVETIGGIDALVELVVAIGNWRLFSSLLRTLGVPLEDGIAPWPPDGASPTGSAS